MKKDNWIIKAFLMTFFIALFFNAGANIVIEKCNYIALIVFSILFILLGIIFDIIGTAVLTAKESTFHAKSAKKIKGAKESINLIKTYPDDITIYPGHGPKTNLLYEKNFNPYF